MAVQWFHSIDDFVGFMGEPAYRELIAPDERRFLDLDRIDVLPTSRYVIQPPG